MAYYNDEKQYFEDYDQHAGKKKVLFEGDSWFSIPDAANLPVQLDSLLDLSILCLADPGDTLKDLTEGRQFRKLESLIRSERYGQTWDAIVLSAGGNDIIGPEISNYLVSPQTPSNKPEDYIDEDALQPALDLMTKRFNALKRLRDNSSANPDTPILVHTYSYLAPRNAAHRLLVWKVSGPWIFPHMLEKGITDGALQRRIVKYLLDRFHETLDAIASARGSNFHVIDSRRALPPAATSPQADNRLWGDEIHPTSIGFNRIARKYFVPALRELGIG